MSTNALVTRPTVVSRMQARHVLGVLGGAILVAALLLDPHRGPGQLRLLGFSVPVVGCAFRVITGYPCPSCGMTRSVCYTTRGDLGQAMQMHPVGPLFAVAMGLQVVYLLLSLVVPAVARTSPDPTRVALAYGALVTAMLVAGALRTLRFLPWPPL